MKRELKDETRKVRGEDINQVSINDNGVMISLKCGGYIEVKNVLVSEER